MKILRKNELGSIAIEFAILVPILLLFLAGVMEFGMNFVKEQIALNAMGSVSDSIQQNPYDPTIQQIAEDSGSSLMGLKTSPNYFCAKSYEEYEQAKNQVCNVGQWDTSHPSKKDQTKPYYVALAVHSDKFSVGLLGTFLQDTYKETVIQVNPSNDNDDLKCPNYMVKVDDKFCIDKSSTERRFSDIKTASDTCYKLNTEVDGERNYKATLCDYNQLATEARVNHGSHHDFLVFGAPKKVEGRTSSSAYNPMGAAIHANATSIFDTYALTTVSRPRNSYTPIKFRCCISR